MRALRKSSLVGVGSAFLTMWVVAQPVTIAPDQSQDLAKRWEWAHQEAREKGLTGGYWIGYSIRRLMEENSYISTGSFFSGSINRDQSLYDIVSMTDSLTTIQSADEPGRNSGRLTFSMTRGGKKNPFKVMKGLAILVRFGEDEKRKTIVKDLKILNMELNVDLRRKPLQWLGRASDDASAQLLRRLFDEVSTDDLKENVVNAIGVHQKTNDAAPFLVKVLKGRELPQVRSQAAFWLAEQPFDGSLAILADGARNDRAPEVREQCVFAVSRVESEDALDTLIALARSARSAEVRRKATFWLGQKASRKALTTLEEMIASDDDTEVQKQALFALVQMRDGGGVSKLIEVAKTHPNKRIRKQAVMCLGESDDERALEALIEIVRK